MSKSSPRLSRPGSAGSKSPGLRKELHGNRSCMLRIGERLMRAGSEGNLVQRPTPGPGQNRMPTDQSGQRSNGGTQPAALEDHGKERNDCSKDPGNSPSRASSSSSSSTAGDSSTEHLLQKKPYNNSSSSGGGGSTCNPDFPPHGPAPRSPSTLPRSYASSSSSSSSSTGGRDSRDRDSQLDRLMMQHSDVERKKEVFLDHLRQKYPHHAAILMGHHELRKEQVRSSPRPSEGGPYTGVLGLVEEQDPLVSDAMSDGEVLPPSVPFTRGTKARASLPAGRSSGQSRERPLGVLYLQYGEETKQVCMPSELSSADALRALFVTAFPHQLTMKMLQSPNMAIYTKDTNRNVYYNLEDVRNITPHSCLKAYHKDPAHVFNRHARPANAEGRISKEVLYGSHSPVHSLASSSRSTLHSLQGSMSPPMVRSMPSSPSRMAYGGGGARGRGASLTESLSGSGRSGSVSSSSSSAILERRDVKPDDDAASCKSLALVVRGDGVGSHYADSYCSSVTDGGRLSLASSQCSGPTSFSGDVVDAGALGAPAGLQQYRASVKPLVGYGENLEHQTCSLHRQKNRKYGDSQLPSLGTKTPPASPHRVNEVRMTEGQIIGGVGLVSPDRMSPLRRSLRRDSNGATVEVLNRSRGSSSSTSSVFVDSPLGQTERQFQAFGTPTGAQTERMKAMEEQIASLAGLVHHALSMGPEVKEAVSENAGRTQYIKQQGGLMESQDPKARRPAPPPPLSPPSDGGLQRRLVSAKRNVCELREQLNQLKRLQLSNQKTVSSMLRMAGQELVGLMCDRLAQAEEAVDPHRAEMEEERISYLATEDKILSQLSELENYVDRLERCSGSGSGSGSGSSPGQTSLTLRDVEEGAVNLRRVGEALAVLKGEFPELQVKMRSVLRLEVEAVRFLKEEPHKMDSMLKRVKALTETLGSLRRHVSESSPPTRSAQTEPAKLPEADRQPPTTASPQSSPRPQPRSSVRPPHLPPGTQAELASVGSASPIMARRRKSAVGVGVQAPHHCPSPPLTPTHGRDSPSVAKVSPRSREGSPALQRRTDQQQEDTPDMRAHTTTERLTPEGSQREETLTGHTKQPVGSDPRRTRPAATSTDLDQVLRMAQEILMEAIPDLEVADPAAGGRSESAASGQPTSPRESKSEQEAPLNLTPQASVEQQACLSNAQVDVPPKPSAEVNSTHLKAADAVSKEPSAPPPAAPSASPVPERRPHVEKPRRSSVDKEMKQNLERASKSPPPPPPRRIHSSSSAHTAPVRSEEVVPATRTEPVGAQGETPKVKEPPVVPQPKPPRQPPEVKPKPQMCAAVLQAAAASAQREKKQQQQQQQQEEEDDDEEEEDNKFMKELQVTTKILDTSDSSSGNKQKKKGKATIAPTLQSANQKCSDSRVSAHQPSAHMVKTNGFPGKVVGTTVPAEHTYSGESRGLTEKTLGKPPPPETLQKAETQQPAVQSNHGKVELSTPTKKQAVNMESLPSVPASLTENGRPGIVSPTRSPKDVVEQLFSPTTAEKKVKFTTIVTLQKENPREPERSPKTTHEVAASDVPAQKKSNMTLVVTLGKEKKPPQVGLPGALLEEKSVSSSQESTQVEKPPPLLPRSPRNHSSKQPIGEGAGRVYTDQSLNSEEGWTLSPTGCDDEGPPPPPPAIGKFTYRMSKTKKKTQSKEDDVARTNGSGTQTGPGDSSDDIIYVGLENPGFDENDEFDSKPIIVILNEPMDLQSAYKRLSTIFESEEDLERILAPESFLDEEEESYEEEDEPAVRTFHFSEANKNLGNRQGAPQTPRERPPASDVFVPGDQDKPHALEKTETKRKFKFKFPKNKLAAISQAIRTGTNKSGKKTLEVVVYEEEEETGPDSRSVKDSKTPTKDHKNVEIISRKQFSFDKSNVKDKDVKASPTKSPFKTEELRKNTLETMDSLEESIKKLELSVSSVTSPSSTVSSPPQSPNSPVDGTSRSRFKGKARRDRERSPSKRPAAQILKGPNPPQSKRAKPQPAEDTQQKTSSKKQTSSSTSSVLRSHTKSRHSSSSGSPEKSSKTPPKQPSQPRVVAIPR